MDRIVWIVSAGLYWLDRIGWIVSVSVLVLLGETGFYALADLLLAGWDGWTVWHVSGTGVGWRDRRYQVPKREHHHWLLRGGGWWEAVAGTNCVGAARAQNIFLEKQNNTNILHTDWN